MDSRSRAAGDGESKVDQSQQGKSLKAANLERVEGIYASFARGDVPAVLGAIVQFQQHTDTAIVQAALR